jgi:hypothetical protein
MASSYLGSSASNGYIGRVNTRGGDSLPGRFERPLDEDLELAKFRCRAD